MSGSSDEQPSSTSALAPDLDAVRTFITDMIAKDAVAGLIAAILALLVRLRGINTALMKRLATESREHPPSEATRRLRLELPFLKKAAANETPPRRRALYASWH